VWFIFRWCLETSSSCKRCYHYTGKTMVSAMQKLNFSTSERLLQQKCLLSHTMLTCTGSNTRNRSLDMVQCGLPSVPRALKYMRYVYAWGKMLGFILFLVFVYLMLLPVAKTRGWKFENLVANQTSFSLKDMDHYFLACCCSWCLQSTNSSYFFLLHVYCLFWIPMDQG